MKTIVKNKKNTYKSPPKRERVPRVSPFTKLEKVFRMDTSFDTGLPSRFVPYILYFTIVGLFYIGNSHYAERMVRRLDKLESEVEDMRANYTTLKASYMYESKQSEVAERVKKLGLEESEIPPFKVVVPAE